MKTPLAKVLLIDDEPAQAWLVRDYLQSVTQTRLDLELAETVADGLQRLGAGDIQVLLLDLSLPDSIGTDTFTKVHDRFPDLPVVVLTSLEDEELGSRLVQLGAQEYLVKGQINGPILLRALRYAVERRQAQAEREKLIHELQQALAEVKKLGGLLPICAHCKKIRDDQGYWHRVESYISSHSEATFTHSLCNDCARALYPEVASGVIDALEKRTRQKAEADKPAPSNPPSPPPKTDSGTAGP
jgi:DNA-binding NarL/FixJ family response regulator